MIKKRSKYDQKWTKTDQEMIEDDQEMIENDREMIENGQKSHGALIMGPKGALIIIIMIITIIK